MISILTYFSNRVDIQILTNFCKFSSSFEFDSRKQDRSQKMPCNYSAEMLTEIVFEKKVVPEALEAARQLLRERQSNENASK